MRFLSDATIHQLQQAASWPDAGPRYTVTGVAGRGGSGTVYIARDHTLERDVALKVLDVVDRAGRGASRWSREALILAKLDHPGIVPVHDLGSLPDGRPFYVMKLVAGTRLTEAAGRHDADPSEDDDAMSHRLQLFARMLDAVAFAHAHGIVHRDLKPDNVLVGAFGEVYVMDWGVAAFRDAPDPERVVVGTPGFMPPEQVAADPVDQRADIFALGAILASLAGPSPARPLAAIVRRATAARAEDRYPSVTALADDVNRFRDGRPVSAYDESIGERLLRTYRRYELPILLVVAYVLMRAGILIWTGL